MTGLYARLYTEQFAGGKIEARCRDGVRFRDGHITARRTDYGRAIRFGVFPEPATSGLDEIFTLADIADRAGLDLIGIQDHPYQHHYLDTWMLIATVLARTERITVFPDVANLPLRPPAVMAKAAASLDVISGGRFELGLGAGAFWEAVGAMGGPARSPGDAVDALGEAIDVIRLIWSDQRSVRFDGRRYRLSGVKPGPQPPHDLRASGWACAGGAPLRWSAAQPTAGSPRAPGPRRRSCPRSRRRSTTARRPPVAITPRFAGSTTCSARSGSAGPTGFCRGRSSNGPTS